MSHRPHKIKKIGLRVLVFDIESDKQIREHTIDHFNSEKRKWLNDLIVWATYNRKSVEVLSLKDDRSEHEF